ncbi:LOW QUALITY PROTEIN: hypothetical protein M8C21_028566, partial [Ambrosia artemisiifolia]
TPQERDREKIGREREKATRVICIGDGFDPVLTTVSQRSMEILLLWSCIHRRQFLPAGNNGFSALNGDGGSKRCGGCFCWSSNGLVLSKVVCEGGAEQIRDLDSEPEVHGYGSDGGDGR